MSTPTPLPARLLPLGMLVGAAAVIGWYVFVHRAMPYSGDYIDLRVYAGGGDVMRDGGPLYSSRFTGAHLPFTYPPFAALVFATVSWLTAALLANLMLVVNFCALFVVSWLCLGLLGYPRSAGRLGAALLLWSLAVWTEPVQQTLSFGQVNVLLMLLVIGDLAQPARSPLRGVGIGIAAGFKLIPAIFIPYLLITRQWRAAIVSVASLAGTVVLAWIVNPADTRTYFAGGVFFDSRRVGGVAYVGNQSLHGMLFRAMNGSAGVQDLWLLVGGVAAVVTLLTARAAHRRGAVLLAISLTGLAGLLASPISWSHHWVWVLPGLVLLADWGWRRGPRPTVVAAAAMLPLMLLYFPWPAPDRRHTELLGLIWQVPNRGHAELRWTAWQWLRGELYTELGVVTVAAAAVVLVVAPRARRRRAVVPVPSALAT